MQELTLVITKNDKSFIVEEFEIDQSTRAEINTTTRWRLVGADAVDDVDSSAEDVYLCLSEFIVPRTVLIMCLL